MRRCDDERSSIQRAVASEMVPLSTSTTTVHVFLAATVMVHLAARSRLTAAERDPGVGLLSLAAGLPEEFPGGEASLM